MGIDVGACAGIDLDAGVAVVGMSTAANRRRSSEEIRAELLPYSGQPSTPKIAALFAEFQAAEAAEKEALS
jgi:hypothetical protein